MKSNRHDVRVQFGDCDPAQIVYFPNYARWFDICTVELFESVGLVMPSIFDDYGILGLPMLDLQLSFQRPSRFRDLLTVESTIESFGNASFKVAHTLYNDGHICVTGREVRGWVKTDDSHPNGIRTERIPDEVRALFDE